MLDNSQQQQSQLLWGHTSSSPTNLHTFSGSQIKKKVRHVSGLGSITTFVDAQQLQLDREYLTMQLQNKEETIGRLKQQLSDYLAQVKKLQSKYKRLKNLSKSQWQRGNAVDQQKQRFKEHKQHLERENDELRQAVSNLQQSNAENEQKIATLQKALIKEKESLNEVLSQNAELQSQLVYLKNHLIKQTVKETEALTAFDSLYEQLQQLRKYRQMYEETSNHCQNQSVKLQQLEHMHEYQKAISHQLSNQHSKNKSLIEHLSSMLAESNQLLGIEVEKNNNISEKLMKITEQHQIEREALESQIDYLSQNLQRLRRLQNLDMATHSRLVTQPKIEKQNMNPHNCTPDKNRSFDRRIGSIKLLKARKTLQSNQ